MIDASVVARLEVRQVEMRTAEKVWKLGSGTLVCQNLLHGTEYVRHWRVFVQMPSELVCEEQDVMVYADSFSGKARADKEGAYSFSILAGFTWPVLTLRERPN